ncbi:hypothetical protein CSA56_03790 [candidate division KSB3 bacterium]|uniref:histidine kinase n=1 Tax=candidate division KSB3 bacterium TaxID=2044937 RepID=A0A2G6KIN8_9BACT|nr:MAG: hypothetical protein CSA56_03790 [candidate division KSB3 bacterium]
MRFFTRSVLFFISVIVFQSSLTIILITNISKRSNLEDAEKELKQEAKIVFENYNSWKRGLWKSLNGIPGDPQFFELLEKHQESFFAKSLKNFLRENFSASGVDAFVLKYAAHHKIDIQSVTYNNFSLSDLQGLDNTRSHPYLELRIIANQLCLVGVIRLFFTEDKQATSKLFVDCFILKRLSEEFCRQLVLNRHVHTMFLLDARYVSGTLPEKRFRDISELGVFHPAARESYDIEIENTGYNIARRKIERVSSVQGEQDLILVTLLDNSSYVQRVSLLEKIVLSVSLLAALLTVVLSLFFSRNITRPIHALEQAMQRIRGGQYDTGVAQRSQSEIGTLEQGFNEMTLKIRQDKEQMEGLIREITMLKDYNENIIRSMRVGMLIVNETLRIEKVNTAFLEIFELQEGQVLHLHLWELSLEIIDEELMKKVQEILDCQREEFTKITRAERNRVYDLKLSPVDGHDGHDVDKRKTLGCILIVEDISRKIEFEEKIFQAEKLSSISMLSAGVAHEINNPLGSIMTNVQNLLDEEEDEERSISLKWIEQETRRIAKIVRELLDFSSSDRGRTQESDVNAVIDETISLIGYSLKKTQNVRIRTEFDVEIPHARISEDELKQIVINLVKNSIHALEGQGDILLSTVYDIQEKRVQVFIQDTGKGIREEDIPRIFDPFYTSKRNGEGTGLGLSVVYGIINKYKGTITVNSTEGEGTQICLAIPVA